MPCNGVTIAQLQLNTDVKQMINEKEDDILKRIQTLIEREFKLSSKDVYANIYNGEIFFQFSYRTDKKIQKDISSRVTEFLNQLSGFYYQQKTIDFLKGKYKTSQVTKGANNSKSLYAFFPVKAKITVDISGKVKIITEEGTFEEGKKSINEFLQSANNGGMDINLSSPYEQHNHDHNKLQRKLTI